MGRIRRESITPKQRVLNVLARAKKNHLVRITHLWIAQKAKVTPEFALKTMISLEKKGKVKKHA